MRIGLVLLGLLSLCSGSFSQECIEALQENVDFPGSDITSVFAADAKHCQLLCTQHPSCLFFTFVSADWTRDKRHFYCYLKYTPSGKPSKQTPLQGVTSGFSLKPCNPNPKPYLSEVYQNVDFPGADYKFLFTADYEECQRACTQDPVCQFFTFTNGAFTSETIRFKCHLKFSLTAPRTPVVNRKAGLISGFSEMIQITEFFQPACEGKLFPSTDIPGNDVETLPAASPQHCLALCSVHPRCTFFSYVSNNFRCHLKNNPNEMVTKSQKGVTSGIPTRFCNLNNAWLKEAHVGVDFLGSDIRFELMDDADTCQRTCTADPNCLFYTYVTDTYANQDVRYSLIMGACFLKRSITVPAPPRVTKLNNAVSGFSLRNFF